MIELNRLLDNGHVVVLFKNALNSYTGFTIAGGEHFPRSLQRLADKADSHHRLTDDFTLEKLACRLADKVTEVGEYETWAVPDDFLVEEGGRDPVD
jgi:hypothetical protein